MQVDKEGNVTMEDAAGFFANVFGGERFMAYVSRSAERPVVVVLISHSDRRNLINEGDDISCDNDDDGRGEG